jgi:hypothetical protein
MSSGVPFSSATNDENLIFLGHVARLPAVGRDTITLFSKTRCGNNSAVECNLAKVEVAGSNPVSRSKGGIAKW